MPILSLVVKKSPRTRFLSLAIVFGLAAAACGGGTDVSAPEIDAGSDGATSATGDAPVDAGLFGGEFVSLTGEAIEFGSFEGQDTVLWFWAPW